MEELSEGNALFFPAGDERSLGEQLLEIAENEELHKKLSDASRRLADRFEGARVAEQFEALYRSALEKKGIDCK
jgi:glycosyltransferase involved in cell wall biosynthesis